MLVRQGALILFRQNKETQQILAIMDNRTGERYSRILFSQIGMWITRDVILKIPFCNFKGQLHHLYFDSLLLVCSIFLGMFNFLKILFFLSIFFIFLSILLSLYISDMLIIVFLVLYITSGICKGISVENLISDPNFRNLLQTKQCIYLNDKVAYFIILQPASEI